MAIAASTTFSPKTDCQCHTSSRIPEVSRPRIALPPATAAQTLTARVRSSRGNVLVIVERVAGITSDAPRPSTPRSTISSFAELAVMASADAPPKIESPTSNILRRP